MHRINQDSPKEVRVIELRWLERGPSDGHGKPVRVLQYRTWHTGFAEWREWRDVPTEKETT